MTEIDAPRTYTCTECERSGFRWWQMSRFGSPQMRCAACYERARRKKHRHKQRFCLSCSTEFTTTRTDAKFCSVACKQKAYRLAHRDRDALTCASADTPI
jgi:hypothetical protein